MRIVSQEELEKVTGSKTRKFIGDLIYNKRSEEYMVLAEVPNYDNGSQKVIVVFSHGVKQATLKQLKEGEVPIDHINKNVSWLSEEEAQPYLHYQDEMAQFLAAGDDTKPSSAPSDNLEGYIQAAKDSNAKVWEYKLGGQTFYIIAKTAVGARHKAAKKVRKAAFREVQ